MKTLKSAFEINWPLANATAILIDWVLEKYYVFKFEQYLETNDNHLLCFTGIYQLKNYHEALKMQSRGMEFYKPETQKVSAPQPIQHENLKVSNKSK